jgi:putative SOS response-associated peptidase YedK
MGYMNYDDGCGRYALATTPKELGKRYNIAREPKDVHQSFDVKPGQTLPVVTMTETGKSQFVPMKWGLIPSWSKDPKMAYKLFNARDDNLFKSPIWRGVILRKRVIIPATGFFEWTKPEKGSKRPKQKFYFHTRQLDIFSFAGVWDTWHDVEGKEWKTYSIITTEPNKEMRSVHNRMPVILHQEDEAAWLEPSRNKREDIEPYLRPLEDNGLEVVEVSSDVSAWEYNDESRIKALNSQ